MSDSGGRMGAKVFVAGNAVGDFLPAVCDESLEEKEAFSAPAASRR